jgi:hemerythrin
VQQVAEGLVAYAARHFAEEEAWAADLGIDIAAHHQHHELLLAHLDDMLTHSDRIRAINFVYTWLSVHIDIVDRQLVAAIRALRRPNGR